MIRVVLLSETESLVNPEKMPLLRELQVLVYVQVSHQTNMYPFWGPLAKQDI